MMQRRRQQQRRSSAADAAADEERRARTLVIKGIPVGLSHEEMYKLLFGEEASLLELPNCSSSGSSNREGATAPHPAVRPSRWNLQRVRIVRPRRSRHPRTRYWEAFVEFSTGAAADRARGRLEGMDVRNSGGQQILVESAANPIMKGHPCDADVRTGRPCLFGLSPEERATVDAYCGFDQVRFSTALATATIAAITAGATSLQSLPRHRSQSTAPQHPL